jgi:predicted MFS family arabinose efflux permease
LLTFCFAGGNVIGVPLGGEVLERFGGPSLWNLTIAAGALAALLFVAIRGHIRDPAGRPRARVATVKGRNPHRSGLV